ncbi:MAG TPA: tRNA uridine-5-carboxymethylaminomethyl(34) synthesis GTPase MnmE [Allosphingosinicella sp.]|nr:tRNA uridine-5-carboxymethylaminomethyl(34) synthesis GTPase MnmE [Allosphingosinicella sp.]
MTDTIFALSSGSPPAALAVVRISGPSSSSALKALAGRLPPPRVATLANLDWRGERLDRALVLRFLGPNSATGEDVAELHLHGGRAVVAAVLEALAGQEGLRAAEPGEFTRRAFENGRIDLAEAEGLADLLSAETEAQRRAALAMAGGALSRKVEAWRQRLLALAAALEATLDFSDEGEVGEAWPPGWPGAVEALAGEMDELLAAPPAERLKDGVRLVIAGPPNAGKSSLLNVLVEREAAITSAVPGTTRDVIEVPIAIEGLPYLLIDTAGLRESPDQVEALGVERGRASLASADLVLWLGEPAEAPEPDRSIFVHSKCDLPSLRRDFDVRVSALTGEGVRNLVELIMERARALLPGPSDLAVNARQREAIFGAARHLRHAGSDDMLIAAEAVRQARTELDRVTGRAGVEDMLDMLFGRFCIGK